MFRLCDLLALHWSNKQDTTIIEVSKWNDWKRYFSCQRFKSIWSSWIDNIGVDNSEKKNENLLKNTPLQSLPKDTGKYFYGLVQHTFIRYNCCAGTSSLTINKNKRHLHI